MDFSALKDFLTHKMRMSHIYQPVMIRRLLLQGGTSTDLDIARELVLYDPSQLEYYREITNNMVGQVLRKRGVVHKDKDRYILPHFEALKTEEIAELVQLCDQKVDAYIQKRGDAIWNHRRRNRGAISGTMRYEVLKRAQFRCELCGISAADKALEVDHIEPVNLGGEDALYNYQALCYSCNASKRDRDNTDFRSISHKYAHRERGCIFCEMDSTRIFAENNLAYLIYDGFPVTPLHCLIIPKRHTATYFEATQPEINAINQLLTVAKEWTEKNDPQILGYNIGLNCGTTAGQTIHHTHLHLIPRRMGDVENPRGGIRNMIAGKGDYLNE